MSNHLDAPQLVGMLVVVFAMTATPILAEDEKRPPAPAAATLAAPGRPGWNVDDRTGCWVWNASARPDATVQWSGACPGGPAGGAGTVEWRALGSDQLIETYVGTIREGRTNGRGTLTADGFRYEGEWRDGKLNGRGVQTDKYGQRYEGEFRDNRFNGRGVLTSDKGSRYEGEFRNGSFDGRGVLTSFNGERYEGEWRNNRAEGYGEYSTTTGLYKGHWHSGCLRDMDRKMVVSVGRPISECP